MPGAGGWAEWEREVGLDLCGDVTVLHCDRVNVNVLVATLYYNFARYYHWEKPCKGYIAGDLFVLFLKSACESTITSK